MGCYFRGGWRRKKRAQNRLCNVDRRFALLLEKLRVQMLQVSQAGGSAHKLFLAHDDTVAV